MSLGTKMLVMMLVISIGLFFVMPDASEVGQLPMGFFGSTVETEDGEQILVRNDSLAGSVDTELEGSGGSFVGSVMGYVSDFIRVNTVTRTIMSIFFAPYVFMILIEAPIEIQFLIAGVWSVMYIVATVSFIRGKDY